MAANVENMFFVGREVPWHGLGVSIENAPTSKDAIICAGLDWNVIQQELYLGDGRIAPGFKANVRETDNQLLGIVSDRYKVVQNEEAFSFVDNLLGEGVRYETAGSLANGKRVWMLARLPEAYKMLDDEVEPYLVLTNSHDGSGAIKACMTPVRVVCQNTLNLALNNAARTWSMVHKGKISDKLEEAQYTLHLGESYMNHLQGEAFELSKIRLSDDKVMEYIEMLLPCADEEETRKKKNIVSLREALMFRYKEAPDLQHVGKNAYRFVNAVSDFATHNEPLRRTVNYQENMFGKTIDGNPLIDKAYAIVKDAA